MLLAAQKLQRPVKWTGERSDSSQADAHGRDNVTEAALALDADGKFLALSVDTIANHLLLETVARIGRRRRGGGQKLRHHVEQMARAVHGQAGHQRGFFGAAGRQHQLRVDARLLQRRRHGQRAAHRAQLARQ